MNIMCTQARTVSMLLSIVVCAILTKNAKGIPPKMSSGLTLKIIGGKKCTIADYPYIVSVQSSSEAGHTCAGTLIRPQWVITVRHSVEALCNSTKDIHVIAGVDIAHLQFRNLLKNKDGIQTSLIQKCYWQNGDPLIYDCALLKLKTPMKETDTVKPAKLPFQLPNQSEDLENVCKVAKIAGWGFQQTRNKEGEMITNATFRYDPHLQCIESAVISQKQCADLWKREEVNPSTFCAYKENESVCHGDSGGPVICNGYIYGLISAGRRDCVPSPNHPSIYLRVEFFKDFIQNTIKFEMGSKKSGYYGHGGRWSWHSSKRRSLILVLRLVTVALGLHFCCLIIY